jgi:poly-gamma-glutamate capsule biosynthesis protein CapA/YwtB (metallophosphatase superfamily)
MDGEIRLALAGDVMTARGVDQVLAHPGSPELHEDFVHDARSYVALAERVNGPIPRGAEPTWPWGDVLAEMDRFGPAVRVMNLETSVTRSDDAALDKAVNYRMSPSNVGVLTAARTDVWALANNHVLDYGHAGLLETLDILAAAGLRTTGAGRDQDEAWRPAVVPSPTGGPRVVVASVGDVSSGVPPHWAAGPGRPGVALLPGLSASAAASVAERLRQDSRPGDVRVVSIHWGGNWGYGIPREHRRFAHRLVDAGVHLVHGHSSHHPRPAEVYRGRLVLYGCGDLVNDYEGIGGYDSFRDDLRLLYLARLDAATRELVELRMMPFLARRFTLERAALSDAQWLAGTLGHAARGLGTSVSVDAEGVLELRA